MHKRIAKAVRGAPKRVRRRVRKHFGLLSLAEHTTAELVRELYKLSFWQEGHLVTLGKINASISLEQNPQRIEGLRGNKRVIEHELEKLEHPIKSIEAVLRERFPGEKEVIIRPAYLGRKSVKALESYLRKLQKKESSLSRSLETYNAVIAAGNAISVIQSKAECDRELAAVRQEMKLAEGVLRKKKQEAPL